MKKILLIPVLLIASCGVAFAASSLGAPLGGGREGVGDIKFGAKQIGGGLSDIARGHVVEGVQDLRQGAAQVGEGLRDIGHSTVIRPLSPM